MLKNQKIGMKIVAGIAIMLGIISVVICITIFNMINVGNSSNKMSKVELPSVHSTQEITTMTAAMMLEMRGYIYTSNPKNLEAVELYITDLNVMLSELDKFTKDNKMNKEIQAASTESLTTFNTYVEAKEAYKANSVKFAEIKATLLKTVDEFYASVGGYEESQMGSFTTDMANGASSTMIKQRVSKITGINHVTNNANLARIYTNKALEARDPSYIDQALKGFPAIYEDIDKMMSITTKQVNVEQLEGARAAAKNYEANLKDFKALLESQMKLQVVLLDTGNQLLAQTNNVLDISLQNSIVAATANQGAVSLANVFLIIGFIAALIVGVLVNYRVVRTITGSIKKVTNAAELIAVGDTEFELTVDSKDEIGQLTEAFNRMKENISNQANVVRELAVGNTSLEVTVLSEKDTLNMSLQTAIEAINRLVADTNKLIQAAVDGELDYRADISQHQGEYQEIIKGINKTLDAVIEPVKEASAVLDEFSKGNLNVNVKGQYRGDHAAIKNALNTTISAISSYIKETAEILNKMSDGNLDVQISSDFKGDFISMKNAINNIVDSLNEVLGEINMASEQVATGSRQVAQSSQALSHGSTVQASSIEEITASMTEISEQTKENAINASKANEFSNSAKDAASKGNEQMVEMVSAMRDINDSSASISKIISVIDEIAFQTNILALNAAVEAARAGQHGKGFAVVAEEVRNLAARSANAAKETTVMIENSVVKVGKGMAIAEDTAKALVDIVEGVSKAADLVADIAYASNEQATAISQINEGIYQVSQVTQNNTATAEESAAASEEMTSQAQMLKEMVGRFRLKRGRTSSRQIGYIKPETSYYEAPAMVKSSDNFSISLDDDEFGKY